MQSTSVFLDITKVANFLCQQNLWGVSRDLYSSWMFFK